MDNETRLIRERLTELLDQGRLTGENLAFDGEPIGREENEYRPDGYSHETHKGCRRHRLVDERLAELEKGDDIERRAAEEFPRWFCFDPREDKGYPELTAEDQEQADLAREAFSNAMIRTYWLVAGSSAQQRILPANFVTGPNDDRQFHDECRVIFSNRGNLPAEWPAEALENIDEFIERIRNPDPWL